jgi:hypothetical protein
MTQRVNYNLELLTKYCNDNNITLLKDYSGKKITRETRIDGKCLTQNCENNFNKTFRHLDKLNGYCKFCIYRKAKEKRKSYYLEKYGVEHNSQSQEFKEKFKTTCLKNYGVEYPLQNKEVLEKMKTTCLEKYGVEHNSQTKEFKEKFKTTCLEKYGVEYPLQSQKVRNKLKTTCLEKYGVKHQFQSQEVREKSKATCLEKYGVEYPLQSQKVRNKLKTTCLEKYGVKHQFQSQEVREKSKATCLEKYGVENSMQNSEIAERSSKASYSRKDYTFSSGKIIQIQGYEPYALDELIKTFNEDEIKTGCMCVPEIWYNDDKGLKHRHYVDIFIISQNMCIEVKSTWTAEKNKDNIFKKQQAGKDLGYTYEIWIYNSKGKKVECFV